MADTEIGQAAYDLLRRWESGDPEVIELWKTMNGWVYEGFAQSYDLLGLEFDAYYFESQTYKLGKDIVARGLESGVFVVDEGKGAVVATLPATKTTVEGGTEKEETWFGTNKDGSPRCQTVLRSDGTSVYMTQDLGTAVMKMQEHGLTDSVYVVGNEQDNHFKVLFYLLEALGFDWASSSKHLSYGMVNLPHGKMKSREGNVVDLDNLVLAMRILAEEQIRARDPEDELDDAEVTHRAKTIADSAIKFYLLAFPAKGDIKFDPEASISFEGRTGPYALYAYARGASLLRGEDHILGAEADYSLLGADEELVLARLLLTFEDRVAEAAETLDPSVLANMVFELARAFNQFYHKCPILKAETAPLVQARLRLTEAVMIAIRNGLRLLNIEVLDNM
jgi:arginyl-tRNA synthetase